MQDNEAVLEYLLQRGDAAKALAVLRRPDVSRELFYKFAPGLMAVAPGETVRFLPAKIISNLIKLNSTSLTG